MLYQVSMLPVTGVGAVASGGAAYAFGGLWFLLFAAIAAFTLVGAGGAFVRTMPAMRFLYCEPKQLAPNGRPEYPRQRRRRR